MAEKARREPPECTVESRGDRAVLAPATPRSETASWRDREREGGGDRGYRLPCAVVDDDGWARGGVHGWQLRRVPAGSCLRRRRADSWRARSRLRTIYRARSPSISRARSPRALIQALVLWNQ